MSARISLLATLALVLLPACEGPPGADGADGMDGVDGVDGLDGMDGLDGVDGADGVDGSDGSQGAEGAAGQDGTDGLDGAPGADGQGIGLLNISLTGLIDLGPDAVYEGWIIVNGAPVSTGVFHVDEEGYQTQSTFLALEQDLADATAFVLSIEPVPDADPMPSATHVLAGDFVADSADLSVGHPSALGDDYLDATGSFILKTPSTNSDDTDDRNGIWWLDPTAGPGATLDLPSLEGTGWRYEGWVVDANGPISTGVFADPTLADEDGAGPSAGPDALFSPPFPGQDFITSPIDLTTGFAAVLTIEPYPDNAPSPFGALKPLVDSDISFVMAPALQDMANNAAAFPVGTVTR